jgi:hypothetical protein
MALYLQHTTVPAEKSVADIQRALASGGATAVMVEYEGGQVSAVSFKIRLNGNEIAFFLPCRWQAVAKQLAAPSQHKPNDEADARRIAWRQIFVLIRLSFPHRDKMVDFQEFLPMLRSSRPRPIRFYGDSKREE